MVVSSKTNLFIIIRNFKSTLLAGRNFICLMHCSIAMEVNKYATTSLLLVPCASLDLSINCCLIAIYPHSTSK